MAFRKPHYIKHNHKSESPSNVLIVDTEARIEFSGLEQKQTFRLGYAIHLSKTADQWHDRGFELRSVEDFWNLLDEYRYEKKLLYVFAHNMAYDYAILMLDSYLSSRHIEITRWIIDSVFIIKAGNILFLSTTNYYQKSLRELGEIFGLAKMDTPDFTDCADSELMPYCTRDTQVLTEIVKQHIAFVLRNDLGSFKPTIAGQALVAFRHRFMSKQILVHCYDEILDMEMASYRGGRCEVFKMGHFDDITVLDINSMYPFVMRNMEYPIRVCAGKPLFDLDIEIAKDAIRQGSFFLGECLLDMKKPIIAVKRGKLMFPIGKIRQTITSPEFEYILAHPDCGNIVSIEKAVFYNQAKIFSEYVDFFYGLRQSTSNTAIQAMSKVLLNSLYGKFGQHSGTSTKLITDEKQKSMMFQIMTENETHEIFTEKSCRYVRFGNELYYTEKVDSELARDSVPIIASAVTAYSRMLLDSLIETAGRDNVIYCDTDSLFVNPEGLELLENHISPTELGKLKVVTQGSCVIRGAKDYDFNGVTKLKGVKHDAEKLSEEQYREYLCQSKQSKTREGEHYRQYQFQTKHSRYRNGTPDGIVVLTPVIKTIGRNYDKGVVGSDGIVKPLVFSDFSLDAFPVDSRA